MRVSSKSPGTGDAWVLLLSIWLTIGDVPAWRDRAIEAFPELHEELNDEEEIFSVYALWWELLPLTEQAHREGDEDLLRRIYGFADWCSREGGDLSNAVAVGFYEHLFDEPWMRPLVVPWLSDQIVRELRPLWEAMLSADDMREVDKLLPSRRRR
jgi:hypothetical protein